ncbi:MAG: hypothetical protein ACE5KZ_09455 [Candidatus Scalinduaceae bacterium]
MKQYEAVIKVMQHNGGYATLGFLYQEVLKIKKCEWKTKTPFASIRRIVQDERFFFKIKPGLWALKTHKDKLPPEILPVKSIPKAKQEEYNHTYYQGLLVEIGNLKKYKTFVPNQDKNRLFLGKKLCNIATVSAIYRFSYDHLLQRAKTVDVTWFNNRNMPDSLFEIEHTAPIQNSLSKFVDLQDFYAKFFIVADSVRENDYKAKLSYTAFVDIRERTKFMSYNQLSEWHSKTYQLVSLESSIGI